MALIREHLLKIAFSNKYCYASILRRTDPLSEGSVVVSASTAELREELQAEKKSTADKAAAALVGQMIAQRAAQLNIGSVHFQYDRGQRYHGKLKALLDAVTGAGLPLK